MRRGWDWTWLHALLLWHLAVPAVSQIYDLGSQPVVVEKHTLTNLYVFYVYNYSEAPEKHLGKPSISVRGLTAKETAQSTRPKAELLDYNAIEVTLLLLQEFWSLVDPNHFCSTEEDVFFGRARKSDTLLLKAPKDEHHVHSFQVPFGRTIDSVAEVDATGVYVLIISNCGGFADATIEGKVIVRNSYGYLPGIEYHKKAFYGWLCLAYVGMAFVWGAESIRWWSQLFRIHHCIFGVMVLGVVETFLWYFFLMNWNHTGVMHRGVFVTSIFFAVLKCCFSYILVLVASLGWGVTKPHLESCTVIKVAVLAFAFICFDFARRMLVFVHRSTELPMPIIWVVVVPLMSLSIILYCWIFSALGKQIDELQETKQTDKLQHLRRLSGMLSATLVAACFVVTAEMAALNKSISVRWHYQWFLSEGASHTLFYLVLAAMAYLWKPHENTHRFVYSLQLGGVDEDEESPKEAGGRKVAASDSPSPTKVGKDQLDDDDDEEDLGK